MKFKIDNTNGSSILAPDTYKVRIQSWNQRTSRTKGTPYICWGLEVSAGKRQGYTFNYFTFFEAPAVSYLVKFLQAADPNFSAEELEPEKFVGRELLVTIAYPNNKDGLASIYPQVVHAQPIEREAKNPSEENQDAEEYLEVDYE